MSAFSPRQMFALDEACKPISEAFWLGWQDTEIHVREGVMDPTAPDDAWWGTIARADLRAFCETLGEDGNFHPPAGMVTWSIPESGDTS